MKITLRNMFVVFITCLLPAPFAKCQDLADSTYIEAGTLIVAPVEGENSFQIFSKDKGIWSNVKFDKDVDVVPVVSSNVCAFKMEGKKITYLVAVDSNGKTVTQTLVKPTTICNPAVSGNLAAFHIDGQIYAFSATAGCWDLIESPRPPRLLHGVILVTTPEWIGAFSAKTGKWAKATTKKKAIRP